MNTIDTAPTPGGGLLRARVRRSLALLTATALGVAALTFGSGVAAHAATTRFEAETAARTGGAVVATDHTGYSGTGFVGGYTDGNKGTATTTFTVSATTAGNHTLGLRYANGTGSAKTLTLLVDGTAQQVTLGATAHWDSWATATTSVALTAGSHSIAYRFGTADSGNVNLDALDVTTPAPTTPGSGYSTGPLFEAENATLGGGATVATDHPGYTGSGFVGGYTDGNKGTAATSFQVTVTTAGAKELALRYANGTGSPRTLSLYLDGAKLRQISLPATSNWDTWGSSTEVATLSAGNHTIAYRFDTADSGNLNLDSLTVGASTPPVEPPAAGPGEAESAFISGGTGIATATAGYAGSGYVSGFQTVGARVIRTLSVATAGSTTATVRFFTTTGATRVLDVVTNGQKTGTISLTSGSGWRTATATVPLRAGLNTLGLRSSAATGGDVLIDSVVVAGEVATATRGATVPYTSYEAEAGSTNGAVSSASRTYGTVSAESSGRRSVRLDATGEYVSVTLTKPASGVVLRYSLPDNAAGTGLTSPIAVYANGSKIQDIGLTSAHAWVYGAYPFDNNPSGATPHRFFDETRATIGSWPAGTVLKFQKDSSAVAYIDLDVIDAEVVPAALTAPAGAVSITAHGAAVGGGDDTAAVGAAISAAKAAGVPVWIPAGTFTISTTIAVSGVTVLGAGPWHSILAGTNSRGGFLAGGSNVTLADFSIIGDAKLRQDDASDAAIEGNFGSGSFIQNIWVEHTKVGLWVVNGTDGLYAVGLRIRNTYADGVNFRTNVKNSRVDQSVFRNTGDDSLAMWSDGTAVQNSAFTFNTIVAPVLSNGLAIYGGSGNRVEDNLVFESVNASAGIAISTRFGVPFTGTTSVQRNTLTRTGSREPNWPAELGALWIYADVHPIAATITVRDNTITDSTYAGLLLSWQKSITGVTIDRTTITGSGTYGIEAHATGSATFTNTTVSGSGTAAVLNDQGYSIVKGAGNSGF